MCCLRLLLKKYIRRSGKNEKRGVINQQLSNALAGLGHGDYFLLCDAGFPIPKDVERVRYGTDFWNSEHESVPESNFR